MVNLKQKNRELDFLDGVELTELHTHVGFSISPTMLWEIAHDQGLKLPTKDYWEFEKMVTIHEAKDYEEYLKIPESVLKDSTKVTEREMDEQIITLKRQDDKIIIVKIWQSEKRN